MKKTLLLLSLALAFGTAKSQNLYSYGFSGVTADLTTAGWLRTNQSTLPGTTPALWQIPAYTPVVVSAAQQPNAFSDAAYTTGQTSPIPNGQAGGGNSFTLINFQSTTSTASSGATISNWLISPVVNVQNGDVVTFYTRLGKYSATGTASYADNMQFRMSTNGATSALPSGGPAGLGDFTNLLVEINPALNLTSYPTVWTQYSYTVAGLSVPTDVKFAFRYFVTNAGPNGSNSDIIGVDSFSVDRPTAGTSEFFKNNFAMYPNPASNVINLSSSTTAINAVQLTDINGRTIKNITLNGVSETQINISDLNTGMYFLKIKSELGEGTAKIMKN
ncbi:MAG TPA: choice-of-anchor J domain-containing protein [Flavobacterium sp.]|nr:choice-of-anchor J domain-containing protein [Flavobacterium sp.]